MLKRRNYNEMVTYILDKIKGMDISEDDKKTLFAYITSLESKYFMEMGNVQRWIPCSERLPIKDDCVFIYLFGDSPYIAWHDGVDWCTDDFTVDKDDEPLAWMPLPEPYKED